jgi:catechol 2,3-dioxygenase-like lactoylglutathione lyase family enzyme
VRKAGIPLTDSQLRKAPGLDHIAFEVDSREDWLNALDHVRACGVKIVRGPYVHAPEGGEQGIPGGAAATLLFLDPDGSRLGLFG